MSCGCHAAAAELSDAGFGVDYRTSLLRAAAFHGASHQATQVFQAIVPKQLRSIAIDRQRIQFVFQAPHAFATVNQPPWLGQLKTEADSPRSRASNSYFSTPCGTSIRLLVSMAPHRSFTTSARALIPGNSPAQPQSTRTPLLGGSAICSSTSDMHVRPPACTHLPGRPSL